MNHTENFCYQHDSYEKTFKLLIIESSTTVSNKMQFSTFWKQPHSPLASDLDSWDFQQTPTIVAGSQPPPPPCSYGGPPPCTKRRRSDFPHILTSGVHTHRDTPILIPTLIACRTAVMALDSLRAFATGGLIESCHHPLNLARIFILSGWRSIGFSCSRDEEPDLDLMEMVEAG